MTERYGGSCRICGGKGFIESLTNKTERMDCIFCGGWGTSADVMDKLQQEADMDWEKDRPDDTRWDV